MLTYPSAGLGTKSYKNAKSEKCKMEEKDLLHLFLFFLKFKNRLHHLILMVRTPQPISWDVEAVRARLESQSSG